MRSGPGGLSPLVRSWLVRLLAGKLGTVPPDVRKSLKNNGLLDASTAFSALNAKGRWWARELVDAKAARWSEAHRWNWGP